MTNLSLKERLERLERTPDAPPVASGSSEVVELVPPDHLPDLKTISAIKSLARRGVRLALAKALIEDLIQRPPMPITIRVPHVEDRDAFATEMIESGVRIQFTGARIKNPPHPGGFVWYEIIEPTGLSVTDAAEALGVSRVALSAFLNERTRLSPEMALRIEKTFGVSMDALMRMQTTYDIAEMRRREKTVKVGRRIAAE